ncbi:ammonium transporter [Clostridium polyendosporum]|uniref:Ammonium transporter n=1 Tax=Clostridium polyendosporum TaxID=69208 RepID=A0A919VFR8_9CLOT|nr:ammonium transporter [Clostridium polyendosporum]GIM28457.1 ammonium transporter [Clostridium polyendosporum]
MQELSIGDSSYLFTCTVLVMLMTPGLALFYSGMVRSKNVLSTTMHSYVTMGIVSIQWILIGYTLAFGGDYAGIIGGLNFLGLKGVGIAPNADYAATIPHSLFMMFQLMFAIIAPALISGAYAERFKFSAFLLFTLLWTTLVYDPVAHWVWGVGGWLRNLGALDFAGGNVVHISSGVSGLVVALVVGKRKSLRSIRPHNLPLTMLGVGLLWFGWFGFNAGSALALNDVAMNAFITTNTAAAAAGLSWMFAEWIVSKKPTALGFGSGVVAGLVAITPAAGFVTPVSAIWIGLGGGVICYFSVNFMKKKFGYDDALDAFGCHGIGGTWGAIATGLFATKAVNSAGADGLFYGNPHQLLVQIISIGATYIYAIVATFVILMAIKLVMKLRATNEEEALGLDVSQHGETGYGQLTLEGSEGGMGV